jgi:hypothetical protein
MGLMAHADSILLGVDSMSSNSAKHFKFSLADKVGRYFSMRYRRNLFVEISISRQCSILDEHYSAGNIEHMIIVRKYVA